jgi:hypothetical protein
MTKILSICASVVLLMGCDERPRTSDGMTIAYSTVDVWTDPLTGCQYLMDTPGAYRGALTPRLRPNGTQICEAVENKHE